MQEKNKNISDKNLWLIEVKPLMNHILRNIVLWNRNICHLVIQTSTILVDINAFILHSNFSILKSYLTTHIIHYE